MEKTGITAGNSNGFTRDHESEISGEFVNPMNATHLSEGSQ